MFPTAVIVACLLLGSALSADILAIFPHTGKSHFDMFQPLALELAARGHQMTVVSFFPQKRPVVNYTDISLVGSAPLFVSSIELEKAKEMVYNSPATNFLWVNQMGLDNCKVFLNSTPVQTLLSSGKKFDLIMTEVFNSDCSLGLVDFYRVPYIGLSTCMTFPYHGPRVGNPDSLAHASNLLYPFSSRMSYVQRVVNTVATVVMRLVRAHYFQPLEKTYVDEVLKKDVPLESVANNVSLILVNTHHSVQGVRPLVPAYVEVGGIHIRPARPIDQELESFLTSSPHGVVVVSMGSVLRSSSFPPDKRQAIMDAFAELPVRVLMKWESDSLPGKPDNVRLSKWVPQRDVLAHNNTVAFVGHGGLLSTTEAVYCGVPMVLMPMFGDQPNTAAHLEATGAAVRLAYDQITKESVLQALRAVLYDSRYRERARSLSAEFRDRPLTALDTAVYWTEYVLRHKGAPHLRSAAVDLPWYQLWLLDVALVCLAIFVSVLLVTSWLVKRTATVVSHILLSSGLKKKME